MINSAMRKNQQKFNIIIIVIACALFGLVALQVILLDNARKLEQQAFQQAVRSAMANIARKVETLATLQSVFAVHAPADSLPRKGSIYFSRKIDSSEIDIEFATLPGDSSNPRQHGILKLEESLSDVIIDTSECDSLTVVALPYQVRRTPLKKLKFWASDASASNLNDEFTMKFDSVASDSHRVRLFVNRVIADLQGAKYLPLAKRIAPARLVSIFHAESQE